ncbi:MAG: GDSL-type esterase/lipase family protein [Ktedonobacterales bacterium]
MQRYLHLHLRDTERTARRRAAAAPISLLLALLLLLAACGAAATAGTVPHATPTATVHPPVVYVALGASDAVGVGASDPNTQGYVPILISRLPTYSQAFNYGVSGYTLRQALQGELPQALAQHPSLITIWLVGNDFKGCVPLAQYAADLDNLLGQLQAHTTARVFVANAPDFSQLPYFQQGAQGGAACVVGQPPAAIRALTQQWNAVINPLVARHGDVLVDLFNSNLANHPELVSSDGFHPSSAGYLALANLFWAQITAHGGVPAS